jgi:hypothetical protein
VLTVARWLYLAAVTVVAVLGFTTDSAPLILTAAALTLPASVIALPAYYLVYGLLALLPGANPSEASGSFSCTPAGECTGSESPGLATWFAATADVVGILALVAAAFANVWLLGRVLAVSRSRGAVEEPVRDRT